MPQSECRAREIAGKGVRGALMALVLDAGGSWAGAQLRVGGWIAQPRASGDRHTLASRRHDCVSTATGKGLQRLRNQGHRGAWAWPLCNKSP